MVKISGFWQNLKFWLTTKSQKTHFWKVQWTTMINSCLLAWLTSKDYNLKLQNNQHCIPVSICVGWFSCNFIFSGHRENSNVWPVETRFSILVDNKSTYFDKGNSDFYHGPKTNAVHKFWLRFLIVGAEWSNLKKLT